MDSRPKQPTNDITRVLKTLDHPDHVLMGKPGVAPKQFGQWQPISTAPKDGTHILGYGLWAGEINGIDETPTVAVIFKWSDRSDYGPEFNWSVHGTDGYAAWMKPTHWMLLPAPPGDET